MTDRSKQIIPDSQAVTRFDEPEILEILDLHSTFTISELLEMVRGSSIDSVDFLDRSAFIEKITNIITGIIQKGHSQQYLMSKVSTFIRGSSLDPSKDNLRINNALFSGINCNLLQPDGKGWQKGQLKICFEFTLEETESLVIQGIPVENDSSPLDEIRQLSNELTSMVSIEQN